MRKLSYLIVLVVMGLVLAGSEAVYAEFYKWVDESGTVNFTDDPTKVPEKYRSQALQTDPADSGGRKTKSRLRDGRSASDDFFLTKGQFAEGLVANVPGIVGAWWVQEMSLMVKIDMAVFGSNPKAYARQIADEVSRAASIKFDEVICVRVYYGKQRVLARSCGK